MATVRREWAESLDLSETILKPSSKVAERRTAVQYDTMHARTGAAAKRDLAEMHHVRCMRMRVHSALHWPLPAFIT
jgi:hypothetical protein